MRRTLKARFGVSISSDLIVIQLAYTNVERTFRQANLNGSIVEA